MNKKKVFLVGNWKMHKTQAETEAFIRALLPSLSHTSSEVWIAPSFCSLVQAVEAASGHIQIGAQNMHPAPQGAFTGEVSAEMLKEVGVSFVILGHSERRTLFHETDDFIAQKVKKATEVGLTPILCIGETLKEHEQGLTAHILEKQLTSCLTALPPSSLLLAYEPVWAIGTGKSATRETVAAAHAVCKECLTKLWGKETSEKTPILYGGSVQKETASLLIQEPLISGFLIGGASLQVDTFINIILGVS